MKTRKGKAWVLLGARSLPPQQASLLVLTVWESKGRACGELHFMDWLPHFQ